MPMPIDAAMLEATFFQMSPPAIVRPAIDFGSDTAAIRRSLQEIDAAESKRLADWVSEGEARLNRLDETLKQAGLLEPRHLEYLHKAALIIEKGAEEFAIQMSRDIKKFRRMIKQGKGLSPELGRIVEETLENTKVTGRRELEARLDAALAFRALEAAYTPDNATGFTINSSADVDRVFAEAMAAL